MGYNSRQGKHTTHLSFVRDAPTCVGALKAQTWRYTSYVVRRARPHFEVLEIAIKATKCRFDLRLQTDTERQKSRHRRCMLTSKQDKAAAHSDNRHRPATPCGGVLRLFSEFFKHFRKASKIAFAPRVIQFFKKRTSESQKR